MIKIAFWTVKGGSTKSTTSYNVAISLCKLGYDVLFIDTDYQSNSSYSLGIDPFISGYKSYQMLISDEHCNINDLIQPCRYYPKIHIIPNNALDDGYERHCWASSGSERILSTSLRKLDYSYDYVIVDTRPDENIGAVNALYAADYIIHPIICSMYHFKGLRLSGVALDKLRHCWEKPLPLLGILISCRDKRLKNSINLENKIRSGMGDLVFRTTIPTDDNVKKSEYEGKPIPMLFPNSKSVTAYDEFVTEMLDRIFEE